MDNFAKMQNIPKIMIRLDATQKSTLNWEDSILKAKQAVEQNAKMIWELDFGLFDRLSHPLTQMQQFQSFCLAIDHFREVIWSQFIENSLGVCLYQGPLDQIESIMVSHQDKYSDWLSVFLESKQLEIELRRHEGHEDSFLSRLFCRNIALDYIKQLAGQLPYGATPMIQPCLLKPLSAIENAIFFNEEFYKPLEFGKSKSCEGSLAICLPPTTHFCSDSIDLFNIACEELKIRGRKFRYIAEEALILSLEGLDELIVAPQVISLQGKRKLQGFCAAGGTVVTVGNTALGLPQELPFALWINNLGELTSSEAF